MPRIIRLFDDLAAWTWQRLGIAHECGIQQGETTLTDSLLLDIAAARIPQIRIYKPTQIREGAIGFDWEWHIGTTTKGWLRFVVQAKTVKALNGKYESLRKPVNQINLLANYAADNGASAMYCFYNHPSQEDSLRCWSCHRAPVESHFGCSLVPIHVVRQVHARGASKTFRALHVNPTSLPWRCLFEHLLRGGRRAPVRIPDDDIFGDDDANGGLPNHDHDDQMEGVIPEERAHLPDYLAAAAEKSSGSVSMPIPMPSNDIGVYPRRIMVLGWN